MKISRLQLKLILENNLKQVLLTEVTFEQAKNNLNDKTLNKAFKAAKWDYHNKEQLRKSLGRTEPTVSGMPPREYAAWLQEAKKTILKFIPKDIEEKHQGISLLWLMNRVLKKPPGKTEELLRIGIFDGPWGAVSSAEGDKMVGIDNLQIAISGALETFFQHNRFMSKPDINSIKTLKELVDVVEAAKPNIQAYLEKQSYLDAEQGKQVIYEDDSWQIIIPTNKGAACELGKGTEWCTAVADAEYYEQYHKPDDPLFIFVEKVESGNIEIQEGEEAKLELKVHPPSKKITIALYNEGKELVKEFRTDFERIITFDTKSLASGTYHYVVKVSSYQFHFGSKQFMDRDDLSIKGDEIFYKLLPLLKRAENVPAHIKEKIKNVGYQKLDNGKTFLIDLDGNKEWRLNGKRHRTDGPAVEYADGGKFWYQNGKRHRTEGPAFEWANGTKEWWLSGKRHRTDGPAVEKSDGGKQWWLNGKWLTEEEWRREVQKLAEHNLNVKRVFINKILNKEKTMLKISRGSLRILIAEALGSDNPFKLERAKKHHFDSNFEAARAGAPSFFVNKYNEIISFNNEGISNMEVDMSIDDIEQHDPPRDIHLEKGQTLVDRPVA